MYPIFKNYHFMYWKTCWRGGRSFRPSDHLLRRAFSGENPSSFISFELFPLPTPHSYPSVSLSLLRWKPPPKVDRFSGEGVSWRWRSGRRWMAEMVVWSKMSGGDGGLIVGDGGLVEDGWQRWRSSRRRWRSGHRRWRSDRRRRWSEVWPASNLLSKVMIH